MKFSKEPQKNNLDEGKTYNGTIFDSEEVKTMNNTTIMPSLSKNLCKSIARLRAIKSEIDSLKEKRYKNKNNDIKQKKESMNYQE